MSEVMREPPSTVALPSELIWKISFYLTSATSNNSGGPSGPPDRFYKPPWANISGFSRSSKALRTMALRNWFRIIHILQEDDWETFALRFPCIFKYTSAVHWHCSDNDDYKLACKYFERFANLTSVRLILPIPTDVPGELLSQRSVADYLKAIPRSLSELEVINSLYPSPESMRFIADAFPDLCILRMRQPAIWCSLCFTCSIPHFARPFPERTIAYTSGKGLPAFYAARLAGLRKLHTVVITVGVEKGVRPFDEENAYCWSGECEMCILMMDNDAVFREACMERKKSFDVIPPSLNRVEWHFQPMSAFDDEWARITVDLYE